jgi:leucyl aminopeptidase
MWAAFLANFCDNNEKFVHLDIAWVSDRKDDYWVFPAWSTGFWVKSISEVFLSLK